jgi:antitoxin ParD1/3/4
MNLNLGEQWEEYVRSHVESGRYNSASELIRECLRLHEEKEILFQHRLKQLAAEINKGIESFERGEDFDGEQVFAEIRAQRALRRKLGA